MEFLNRHIGLSAEDEKQMLKVFACNELDQFMSKVFPQEITSSFTTGISAFPEPASEHEATSRLAEIANENTLFKSYLGQGYYNTLTPAVIRRTILENPGWYTQYTPYQAEIAQGRLEALFNFQTMIARLTGLPLANASLLDEATAVAEAAAMAAALATTAGNVSKKIAVHENIFRQTKAVLETRCNALDIEIEYFNDAELDFSDSQFFAIILQSPDAAGVLHDFSNLITRAKKSAVAVILACDPLALMITKSPAAFGVDIAVGSTQRFGVPLFYGGPHAAFIACTEDYKRLLPGRIVGLSKDASGVPAYRLALQTREQHIRREKATSNICTAQVLLAVIASMYAVYHGDGGLKKIASDLHALASFFGKNLKAAGYQLLSDTFFDTIQIKLDSQQLEEIAARAERKRVNLFYGSDFCQISFDETVGYADILQLFEIFGLPTNVCPDIKISKTLPDNLLRKEAVLTDAIFNTYHSETEFLRYVKRLENKDLSLTTAMIPLGSCTMKLNAAAEMFPVSWPEFASLHPMVPAAQAQGYLRMIKDLELSLAELTGLPAVSLQPNAGSQGEYAGLLAIKAFHDSKNEPQRKICLIPKSAHGTNPASAVMAGMQVVVVNCDEQGNIDFSDLKAKCAQYKAELAALMITYPSTHGVYERNIKEICTIVHEHGGQVYMDGANFNALVAWCRPGELGVDVMHFNLHKTFCIPHGGGGPGVGPIAAAKHLQDFMPGNPFDQNSKRAVAAAYYGSAGILVIPWMYLAMMSFVGLRKATAVAVLNANYIAQRLKDYFPVLYTDSAGFVAHECIIDLRSLKAEAGIEVEDVAKRLMDYGFHAPTVSWPVPGTLMIEPTESESKAELDRFCEALIGIAKEVEFIKDGTWSKADNPLKNAPHTAAMVIASEWEHSYSRETAAFPFGSTQQKFWPAVRRIDGVYGDRNLICTCEDISSFS